MWPAVSCFSDQSEQGTLPAQEWDPSAEKSVGRGGRTAWPTCPGCRTLVNAALMLEVRYKIDGTEHRFGCTGAYSVGDPIVLSDSSSDITFGQDWYQDGYGRARIFGESEFHALRAGLESTIGEIVSRSIGRAVDGFTLAKYHRFIGGDEEHLRVVRRTRDLFAGDFGFPVLDVVAKFESILGYGLCTRDPRTDEEMHIIVRINRPGSADYNPPHKDIYEHFDGEYGGTSYLPAFMNFWIPVCGVDAKTSLPLVPGSHLLPEDQIERTSSGAVLNGREYHVRAVKSWAGRNDLTRPEVGYGEALMFSGHLIHGLAINCAEDVTRVSLEFRLFRAPRRD